MSTASIGGVSVTINKGADDSLNEYNPSKLARKKR